jgi:hypothetical protein
LSIDVNKTTLIEAPFDAADRTLPSTLFRIVAPEQLLSLIQDRGVQ